MLTADFGRVVAGTLALRLTGPAGGRRRLARRTPGRRGRAVAAERRVLLHPARARRHVRDRRPRRRPVRGAAPDRVRPGHGGRRHRVRTAAPTAGRPFFTCSDPLLDEIHRSACGPST
ncbi:hypothetical protein V2I01_41750 [Micromonospora sp. BRA006-A]|nr:hypothetical protein [Micromonospora sp. BRA006-A]